MLRFILAAVVLIIIVVGVGIVFLTGGGSSDKAPQPVAEATPAPVGSGPPEQALAAYVEQTLGKPFFEDCTKAQPATDTGKICSIAKGERDNFRAYMLGPVALPPTQWAIMENAGGQWKLNVAVPITRDNAAVPGTPWPLRTGVDLVVVGADPCVNVREGPALAQRAIDCIRDGTKIRLTAGPAAQDNFQWWQVEGRTGWIVGDFLRYPDAAQ